MIAVPELTRGARIKLNRRVWLRPIQMSLAWLQSRRLAPKFSLRTVRSGAASYPRGGPAPQDKGGHYTAWPDAGTVPLLTKIPSPPRQPLTSESIPIAKEARQVEVAGFLRGLLNPAGPWGQSAIALKIQGYG